MSLWMVFVSDIIIFVFSADTSSFNFVGIVLWDCWLAAVVSLQTKFQYFLSGRKSSTRIRLTGSLLLLHCRLCHEWANC